MLVAVGALLLKNFGFKGAPVFVCAGILFLICCYSDAFGEINKTFLSLSSYADIEEYTSAAMKVVGIGYLSGIGADACRELGEAGVAKCISILARLEFIMIATPFIRDIMELSVALIGE